MRHLLREEGLEEAVEVDSAGTGSWHVGHSPDERATGAARARGIELAGAARQVTRADFEAFDLILAMDRANWEELRGMAPDADARERVRLLREYDPEAVVAGDLEVPDPYYGGPEGFEDVIDLVPPELAVATGAALGVEVVGGGDVSGGCLNDAWRLELGDGRSAFVKTSADAPPGSYATEAAGLRWLAEAGATGVPAVLAVSDPPDGEPVGGPRFLALEWIDAGRLDSSGEERLGRELAALHEAGAERFGGDGPLAIGPLAVPNGPAADWVELYAEHRLRPLARQAAERGALPDGTQALIDRLCARLPELAGPAEPPARLHGDLWAGNVMADTTGRPYLIDPAAHGGHREADLAMLRLFGGPGERCFAAYREAAPLAEGHGDRIELWQLFPLLVHAVLFGGGYGASVARIARRYVG
jgi:fructosamine-3-kinase/protein-tyrosine-phosphatase